MFLAYILANTLLRGDLLRARSESIAGNRFAHPSRPFPERVLFQRAYADHGGLWKLCAERSRRNSLAAFEAMVGLMAFALGTGLLFGRVSKPSAKIGFSPERPRHSLPGPHQPPIPRGKYAFQRATRPQASVMLMTVEGSARAEDPQVSDSRPRKGSDLFLPADVDRRPSNRRGKSAI